MELKVKSVLDKQFQPMSLVVREMREATKEDGQDIVIGIVRNNGYVSAYKTRIYKDGVIVSSADRVENLRYLGEDAVSYLDFTKDPAVFLREGEIVSDLIFDDRFCIDGYEISGGLWNDLVRGRCYRPRCGKIRQISK